MMKIKILFLLVLLTSVMSLSGQINRLDGAGKKDGKWIIYLDEDWRKTDSVKALYYRYTWYAHGEEVYNMGPLGGKWKLDSTSIARTKGKPVLLDGEYQWKDKNGKTGFVLVFNQGEIVSYKSFYKSGDVHECFDYKRKWKGKELSYCIIIYDKSGKQQNYFVYNGPNGWMGYGTIADSSTAVINKIIGDSVFSTATYFKNGKRIRMNSEIEIHTAEGKSQLLLHGQNTSWYMNGQKKEEGEYYYDKKIGSWKYWDENGNEKDVPMDR